MSLSSTSRLLRKLLPISDAGSHRSNNSNIHMCSPVGLAADNGLTGTGVPAGSGASLEAVQTEQFARLTSSIASRRAKLQKQISDLVAVTTASTKWMQEQQTRSSEIDKALADFRADIVALQSASVSSVETKSAGSDWPLPKPRRISRIYFVPATFPEPHPRLSGENHNTFSPAQLAPEAWHQQDDEFQRSAVLVGFPSGQNRGTVRRKFCDESFPNVADAFEIMCKVSCSNCVTYDVNNCAHPLAVLVLCVFGTCRAFLVPTEGFSHMVSSC